MNNTAFEIRLKRNQTQSTDSSSQAVKSYSNDLDSVVSIHADICDAIQETGAAEFVVSGFGQERWAVDIHTDLLTILEQLPVATAALRESRQFLLDFYEQGVERALHFQPLGDTWRVNCTSRTSWRPQPDECEISHDQLVALIRNLVCEFKAVAQSVCPRLVSLQWHVAWAKSAHVT